MSTVATSAPSIAGRLLKLSAALLGIVTALGGAEPSLQEIQAENRELRTQLATQQKQLSELQIQMNRLSGNESVAAPISSSESSARSDGKLILSGEVGLAFYSSSKDGRYPKKEFRVDDANIRLEAAVAKNTYFFGELQLSKHESADEAFHLGEFYVDFENVSGLLGGPDRLVNVRFGRFDIPFGEEYLVRDPLANPLITHSLSDVWGTDEGVELYGEFGKASYAFAIQNGSTKTMHDYNADKSLTLRVGYDLLPQLHVSGSIMRTGELASALEPTSEVWFGNVIFRNISLPLATTHEADLAELDATYRWKTGRLWLGGGTARYRDNNRVADNTRKFTYFQAEAVQSVVHGFYVAARFSTLHTGQGYPIAGIGNFVKYFLTPLQTKELQRLSVGGGYRFGPSLVIKTDYTSETGKLTTGGSRDNHLFSFETAIGF